MSTLRAAETSAATLDLVVERMRAESRGVHLLAQRSVPGPGATLDLVAISGAGVRLVAFAPGRGAHVRRDRRGDLLVGGQRQRDLTDDLTSTFEYVLAAVQIGPVPQAPVAAACLFLGAHLPRRGLDVDGIACVTVTSLLRLLHAPGRLTTSEVDVLAADLADRFPAAR